MAAPAEAGEQVKQPSTEAEPAVEIAQPKQQEPLDPAAVVADAEPKKQDPSWVAVMQEQSDAKGEHEPAAVEGTAVVQPAVTQPQPVVDQSQPIVAEQQPAAAQPYASTTSGAVQKSPVPVQAAVPSYIPVVAAGSASQVHNNGIVPTGSIPTAPTGKPPALSNEYTKGNNLIVNYVPKSFSDVQLYELFAPFGEIESARAIQDRHTGQCAGYGFIKFKSADAAANAVKHYETAVLDHRQLKVHFARPSSTHKQCNIYISGLPIHYTEDDTKNLFAPFGPVVEVKVLLGKDGESRGCGFVRLCNIANTHAAINALNESVPPGGSSRINVVIAAGTKRETANNPAFNAGHVPFPAQFMPYGQVPPSHPMQMFGAFPAPAPYGYPQAVGAPAGYPQAVGAPAGYPQAVGSPAGVQNFGGYQPLRHQPIRTDASPYGQPITPVKEHFTGFCLFVFNLPMEYDENALRAMFGQFGQVTSARLMRDPATGRSKGYGFVNMGAENQAQMAIQALNGYPMNGKALKVQFKTPGPTPKPPTTTTPSTGASPAQNFYVGAAKAEATPPPPTGPTYTAAVPSPQTPNYFSTPTKAPAPDPQAATYYGANPLPPSYYGTGSPAATSYYAAAAGTAAAGVPPSPQMPSYYMAPPGSSPPPQQAPFY